MVALRQAQDDGYTLLVNVFCSFVNAQVVALRQAQDDGYTLLMIIF